MKWENCFLAGVRLLHLPHYRDRRGEFIKVQHANWLSTEGIDFAETYYTRSGCGVLRGMHFQYPPHDYWKMLTCTSSAILDVCVDLRLDSPTRGKWMDLKMRQDVPVGLLLSPGIVHGFLAKSEDAVVLYQCSTVQAPESEGGVHWQGFGYEWPVKEPIFSDRDLHLPSLQTVLADPRILGGHENSHSWSIRPDWKLSHEPWPGARTRDGRNATNGLPRRSDVCLDANDHPAMERWIRKVAPDAIV